MAPILLASIHLARNGVNTHEQNECHVPLISKYVSMSNCTLMRECDVTFGLYHLNIFPLIVVVHSMQYNTVFVLCCVSYRLSRSTQFLVSMSHASRCSACLWVSPARVCAGAPLNSNNKHSNFNMEMTQLTTRTCTLIIDILHTVYALIT